MQWVSSLLIARLACPLCVHSRGRIVAREEANKKRLAIKRLQTILNLCKKALCDVVRENHLAVGLVGGHGGVVGDCESKERGVRDWKERPLKQLATLHVCLHGGQEDFWSVSS